MLTQLLLGDLLCYCFTVQTKLTISEGKRYAHACSIKWTQNIKGDVNLVTFCNHTCCECCSLIGYMGILN
jgi:hypothetical protein